MLLTTVVSPGTRGPVAWPLLLAALWLAVAAGHAAGQETYRLEGEQWQKQAELDPQTPEGELQEIRRLLAEDRPGRAGKLAGRWIKRHPEHPDLAAAYLLRADALTARREYYKALFDYEYLIRMYPGSEYFLTALEREYEIARLFAAGMRRKLWGIRFVSASDEAEELFIRIQERAPGSAIGEQASLALGDFYFDRGKMLSAAEAYDLFLLNYPDSAYRERAMLQLIRASLATFKGPRFDATGLREAAFRIRTYQQAYPAAAERLGLEALLVRIDESLALKMFHNARWYERTGKDLSATYMYRRLIHDHPQTAAAAEAVDRLEGLGAVPPSLRAPANEAVGAPTAGEGEATEAEATEAEAQAVEREPGMPEQAEPEREPAPEAGQEVAP